MCEYCAAIKLAECFRTPAEYEQTIAYIRCLVQEQGFVFEGGNCALGHHVDEQGHWVDDIIYHSIKCPRCGQVYTCVINTYNGRGGFEKGR